MSFQFISGNARGRRVSGMSSKMGEYLSIHKEGGQPRQERRQHGISTRVSIFQFIKVAMRGRRRGSIEFKQVEISFNS
jgi:hypothetical protein